MIYLPDTNACISLLRQKQPQLIARWRSTKVADITLCSIVVMNCGSEAVYRCNPVQGATATLASTAILGMWILQLTDSKEVSESESHSLRHPPRPRPVAGGLRRDRYAEWCRRSAKALIARDPSFQSDIVA